MKTHFNLNSYRYTYNKVLSFFLVLCILFVSCGISGTYSVKAGSSLSDTQNNITEDMPVSSESTEISGTLDVMSNVDIVVMQPYLDGFMQKYPDVTLNYHCLRDYENEMREHFENNTLGDVILTPSYTDRTIVETYLEPLGAYDDLARKYNYLYGGYKIDEYLYSLPSSAYLTGIIYNKDVFYQAGISETPKSIEEFYNALIMIKERTSAIPFATGYAYDWALGNWTDFPYIEMTGNPNYKGNEFIYINNPFTRGKTHYEVYGLLYDIVHDGLAEPDINVTEWYPVCQALNKGEIACMIMGSWALSQIKSVGPNPDSIGFMPFPNEIDGKQYMTITTDYCYAISKNSDNKATARAYIDYILDESGYAFEQERISIVKTDPYPDAYGDMDNVIILSNDYYNGVNYTYYQTMSAAINPSSTAELKRIVEAAAGVRSETFEDIMKDWNIRWETAKPAEVRNHTTEATPVPDVPTENPDNGKEEYNTLTDAYQIELSVTENNYIQEVQKIKVGYLKNMAPFQYEKIIAKSPSDTLGFNGVCALLCETISESTGLQLEYVSFNNTAEMLSALEAGTIDMAAGVEKSDIYGNRIRYSKEYLEYINVIIRNETVDGEYLDYKNRVVLKGDEASAGNTSYITADSLPEMIDMLDTFNADYAITNYYSAEYYVKDAEAEHVVIVPLTQKSELCFAFAKNVDTRLISICNKCLYGMPKDSLQVMLLSHMDPPEKAITLIRFMEANPTLTLSIGLVIFLIISGTIILISNEKVKSARKHEIDIKRYQILAQLTDEYVYECDFTKNVIQFDKKFNKHFNFNQMVSLVDYYSDNSALNKLIEMQGVAKLYESYTSEPFELEDMEAQKQWYRMTTYRIQGKDNETSHLIGKLVNIQEIVEEQQRMQDKAERDALTGLYNRIGFEKCMKKLEKDNNGLIPVAFAVLDYDNFKAVNDTLGHSGGDHALKKLASNLTSLAPDNSFVSRYGGDEFMICIYGLNSEDSEGLFNKLVTDMDTDITYRGIEHHISISLGAVYIDKLIPFSSMFEEADKVLYEVKEKGKNNYKMIKL